MIGNWMDGWMDGSIDRPFPSHVLCSLLLHAALEALAAHLGDSPVGVFLEVRHEGAGGLAAPVEQLLREGGGVREHTPSTDRRGAEVEGLEQQSRDGRLLRGLGHAETRRGAPGHR